MGDRPNCLRNAAGYSLLEVMIGGLLLGLIALALLPAFFTLNNSLKVSAFQTSCNSIVRAKLQEYVNGMNIPGYTGSPSGFDYTKYRFLTYSGTSEAAGSNTYYYCQENPAAGLSASPAWYYPGYREKVNDNTKVAHDWGDDPANPDVPERLQGFQLYVNIRHYNPRYVGVTSTGTEIQPRRQCPIGSAHTTPADYQFFRLGDALEVVVTGMIRTNPARTAGGRGGAAWGPFKDASDYAPNPRLVCSATQVIYPPRLPFRYYLGTDGKIRNYQATAWLNAGLPNASAEAMEAHFRSIWSQNSTATGTTATGGNVNIRSISVSPENNRVYVLRPGELTLYKNCTDRTVSMYSSILATTLQFPQTPDCELGTSDVSIWRVDSNIDSVTVNFKDVNTAAYATDKVYAIFNTGGNTAGEIKMLDLTSTPNTAVTVDTGSTSGTFKVPGTGAATDMHPRIQGIFLAQSFPFTGEPNLFYFDNSCASTSASLSNYCVSVFNSADANMVMPVRDMPVQTESISY